MNLIKTTKNISNYSILSLIVAKTILQLSKYQDTDISDIVNSTVNNIVKDNKS